MIKGIDEIEKVLAEFHAEMKWHKMKLILGTNADDYPAIIRVLKEHGIKFRYIAIANDTEDVESLR